MSQFTVNLSALVKKDRRTEICGNRSFFSGMHVCFLKEYGSDTCEKHPSAKGLVTSNIFRKLRSEVSSYLGIEIL